MSNLPNSIIRLVPPSLRGGYCPDSWQEFANELVCGTQAQHSASRGTTFYNFGNQSPYPPAVPTPAPCTYDLLIDVEPSATDFSNKIGWVSVNTLEPDNGVTELSFDASGTLEGSISIGFNTGVTRIVVPNATASEPGPLGSWLSAQQMPDLTEIDCPLLQSTALIRVRDNPAITSISMPSLTGGYHYPSSFPSPPVLVTLFTITDNPALTTINLGSFSPDIFGMTSREHQGFFQNNALTAATVNHILSRFVSNSSWGSNAPTLNLSGGTNAAPTGQGIIDKATLISRGATVLTN
jgi:hypothetical protein